MLDILWLILIFLIIILGIRLSFYIKFKNYKIFSLIKSLNFNTLFISLGTKMGVGALIGTSMSVIIGGPGSLIWMFLFTLLTSSIIYTESYLGNKYKETTLFGNISGIYFYTKNALNKKSLAIITLILFIITYSIFFLMIQTNTISNILNINKYLISFIILIFLLLLLNNNISELTKLITKIVPIVSIFFISISVFAIGKHYYMLPSIIKHIIYDAFNSKSILTGMIIGIKRSIFLNELLIGTASFTSSSNKKEIPNTLVLGTYFITFVISTLIALLLLTYTDHYSTSYIKTLLQVFTYHFGNYGHYFLALIICLLGTSSIISGIYIGLSNLTHLTNKKVILIFKIILTISLLLGIFISTNNLWLITDISMLILISLNIYIINKIID